METNLIKPDHEKFRTFYQSHIDFCEDNHCAAGLLNIFDVFHGIKIEQKKNNQKANNIAERHGDARYQDEHLFQSHTQEELSIYLMGLFSIKTIRVALQFLIDKKILTTHKNPNPKYQFDKTTYYLFHPEIFNMWIKKRINPDLDSRDVDLNTRSGNFAPSNVSDVASREGNFTPSNVQNSLLRERNFAPAINNRDLNKKNNHNLTLTESERIGEEKNPEGSVEGSFFENQKIEKNSVSKISLGAIGKTLSAEQEGELQRRFQQLPAQFSSNPTTPGTLLVEMRYCLLDKTALTQCDNDFHRKLCCIEGLIRKGKWRTPIQLTRDYSKKNPPENIASSNLELKKIDEELRELQQAIQGDNNLMQLLPDSENTLLTKSIIAKQNQTRGLTIQALLAKKQKLLTPEVSFIFSHVSIIPSSSQELSL